MAAPLAAIHLKAGKLRGEGLQALPAVFHGLPDQPGVMGLNVAKVLNRAIWDE